MIDTFGEPARLAFFLGAALILAITPGPGMLYVAARALAGGRTDGLASSFGTGIGGLAHVAAGALGVSAVLLASAQAFTLLKFAGALYLVHLGIKAFREAGQPLAEPSLDGGGAWRAFREGIVVEALNPKTAVFFLAFLPQFVDSSRGQVALQFAVLGAVCVALNTAADVVATCAAVSMRRALHARAVLMHRVRQASAAAMCALGLALAFARKPA